jgi:cytoskeletal protein CcmA (bactofilin family)
VELRSGSVVRGNIHSPRLAMEEGASLHGGVDPTKAPEGDKKD